MLAVSGYLAENSQMIDYDSNGYFVTGSDTDVGKTDIACQIVAQLQALGVGLETRKPAESGCVLGPGGRDRIKPGGGAMRQRHG